MIAVDVQWRDVPPNAAGDPYRWRRCASRSTTVTGRAGRVKPIASDIFDALADVAEREGVATSRT